MPKRKANWWPASILADPDVLSVDDEGRHVLCKICHVHYAVHGGKKPKPVIMNSNFRTRAWDVHKERTNSHRLQKAQEKAQQKQQAQKQQKQKQDESRAQAQGQTQAQTQVLPSIQSRIQVQTEAKTQAKPQAQDQAKTQAKTQAQTQASSQGRVPAQSQMEVQSNAQAPSEVQARAQQQQQRRREVEETKDAANEQQAAAASERPMSASQEAISAVPVPGGGTTISDEMASNGKRPAPSPPNETPLPRRRVFRAGSPGSSRQLVAESEAARRMNLHPCDRHSFMTPGTEPQAKSAPPPPDHMVAMEQAESSARWQHMHDDVSRALSAAPRRRQQPPPNSSYTTGELRAAKTLARTESGTFGGNNSDKVAKKLRSLNAEYHASNMRHADAYNMRHTEVFDRRSAGYKEYWGTLRDVYTSSGSSGNTTTLRKSQHRSVSTAKPIREQSKETEADSTTPDDSGSSEDAFKPAVVVHDASLLTAIERLTDATTKQIASLCERETLGTSEVLDGLTSVMTDLRVQHGRAFERIIELQEKNLKVMQSILEVKLRKEAARSASNSSDGTSSTGNSSIRASGENKSSQNGHNGLHSHSQAD